MLCAILLIDRSYLINAVSLGVECLWQSVDYCVEELKVTNRAIIKNYSSNSKVHERVKPSSLPSGLIQVKNKDMPIVSNNKDTEVCCVHVCLLCMRVMYAWTCEITIPSRP